MNALLLREAANQKITMEKWTGYEEQGSLIPRDQVSSDKIKGHEVRDSNTPTLNMTILVLTYNGRKQIVDHDLIKVQPK